MNNTYRFGSKIDFGIGNNYENYSYFGFSSPEQGFTWTERFLSSLSLPVNAPGEDLTLRAEIFLLSTQEVNIYINKEYLGKWYVNNTGTYNLTIPKELVNNYINLTFELPNATSPKNLGINDDERLLGIAFRSLVISNNINLENTTFFQIHPFKQPD